MVLIICSEKYEEVHGKLYAASQNIKDNTEILNIFKKELSLNGNESHKERVQSAGRIVSNIFIQSKTPITDEWNIYERSLSIAINSNDTTDILLLDKYKAFLKLLYKLEKFDVVLEYSARMHTIFPLEIYPLEWMCKIFVDNSCGNAFEVIYIKWLALL